MFNIRAVSQTGLTLITGATGFVGSGVVARLVADDIGESTQPGRAFTEALSNLVDFIVTCITHPQAANQTFLVSDGQDLSTTKLVRGMVQAAGVPTRLLPMPVWALQAGSSLLGKGDAVQRLCGNLQVDISKARSLLGWVPPVSVEEGLRRAMAV